LIIVAIAAFLVWRLHSDLMNGLDASLLSRGRQIASVVEDPKEPEHLDLEEITSRNLGGAARNAEITQIVGPSGRVLASTRKHPAPLLRVTVARRASNDGPVLVSVRQTGAEYRVLALRLHSHNLVVVASSTQPISDASKRLLVLLAFAIPASIALSGLGGYVLARRALDPIDQMTKTAEAIGAHDSDARLDVPAVQDELGRLGRTLNGMLDRLHEGIAEQRRFTSDASHELRTPLSIMQSEVDVALRSPKTPAEARPALLSIGEELGRMRVIVDNLLTLARMDEGRLELVPAEVDVVEIVRSAGNRLEAPAQTKGVRLTIDAPEPQVMWGDRTWLEQLVTNLVDNAIKYTGPGGSIRVGVSGNGNDLVLRVADSGVGIPRESIPNVFDRFYRVDKARTRKAGGTGLGLAICRSIVDAHHGDIVVESEAGKGAVFTVRLPRHS
jgi:heavy metal sensor kinase